MGKPGTVAKRTNHQLILEMHEAGMNSRQIAEAEEFHQLKTAMGLNPIPADEVDLTPRLLKKE